MIRTLYAWLGRLAYWLSLPALFLVSLSARPRVRVILANELGQILLVRNWYGRQRWCLPGGGVKKHEPPVEAARRELREELSLDLSGQELRPLGAIERYDKATPFTANIFIIELSSETVIFRHPLELIDHRWTMPDNLPSPLHASVKQALRLWRG